MEIIAIFILLFNSSHVFTFHNQNNLYFGQSRLWLELNSTEVEPFYIMENKTEIWKDIPEYEGFYQASNLGRIKSLYRIIERSKTGRLPVKEKILKSTNLLGYRLVVLLKNKTRKSKRVHVMVANAFIPNPKNKPFVNHINGIKHDNRVENLEWCTPKENNFHYVNILGNYNKRIQVIARKLSDEDVLEIRKNGKKFDSVINISKKYGICLSAVYRILNNVSYSDVV